MDFHGACLLMVYFSNLLAHLFIIQLEVTLISHHMHVGIVDQCSLQGHRCVMCSSVLFHNGRDHHRSELIW
jgi:hypothetical protein